MALFRWKCDSCDFGDSGFFDSMPELGGCPKCGADMDFCSALTSRIVEVRDNGVMPKKVEQLANIHELVQEHTSKGKP